MQLWPSFADVVSKLLATMSANQRFSAAEVSVTLLEEVAMATERHGHRGWQVGNRTSCPIHLLSCLQARPSWSWALAELLSLLQQYPGGVSESIILTELSERGATQVRAQTPVLCAV